MSNPWAKATKLLPQLSFLLGQTFQTKSLRATTIIHAHLLRTGLVTSLGIHAKLFLSYAGAAAAARPDNLLLPITNLLNSMDPNGEVDAPRWNAVVSAFARHGFPSLALRTFSLMHELGVPSCSYAICSALTASASARAVEQGKQIHAYTLKSGWMSAVFVGGALINFYVKLDAVEDAHSIFDEIPLKNVVCANVLLAGYVEDKLWVESLALVRGMHLLGLEPDFFTLSTVLRMCSEVPAVGLGMQAHAHLIRRTGYLGLDLFLQSSLVEMYGKCGLVQKARLVFDLAAREVEKRKRDVVLWTSMLNAYGRNGLFADVIETFEEMLLEGTEPDEVVFVAVLSACSRTGNVVQGLAYFESMGKGHRVVLWPEHYGCVVDLLCRAGELEKAWKLANEMMVVLGEEGNNGGANSIVGVSASVWGTLLSACKECGNVEMGKVAAQRALELDPGNAGIYVELSNLYARMGRWADIGELRELMNRRGLKKDMGFSCLELTR